MTIRQKKGISTATSRPARLLLWPGDRIIVHRGRRLKLEARVIGRDGDVIICRKDNGDRVRVLLPEPSHIGL